MNNYPGWFPCQIEEPTEEKKPVDIAKEMTPDLYSTDERSNEHKGTTIKEKKEEEREEQKNRGERTENFGHVQIIFI